MNHQKFLLLILSCLCIQTTIAQPLLPDWGKQLVGTWRVERMDTAVMAEGVNMFLEFLPDQLLMHNQQNIKKAEWKVLEAERQILIKSEGNNIEAWQVKYIDAARLAIFDTVGNVTLYLSRYKGRIEDANSKFAVIASRGDLVGNWLLVSIDDAPIPQNVNLSLEVHSSGRLSVKVAKETQLFRWKFNEARSRIKIIADSTSVPIEWIFTEVEKDRLCFIDQGKNMRFTRYVAPLSSAQEAMLPGKWKIMEVGGSELPNNESFSRFMVLESTGKLAFFTNEKKEGEGTWGLNSTKNGLFVLSGGGTEHWNILSVSKDELLLELEELKMLLRK